MVRKFFAFLLSGATTSLVATIVSFGTVPLLGDRAGGIAATVAAVVVLMYAVDAAAAE